MSMIDRQAARVRLEGEAERLRAMIDRATPVAGCGPAIPTAPARGPQVAEMPRVVMPDGKSSSGYKVEEMGWRGFKAVRAADIFDDLARIAAAKGREAPFTKAQVTVARRYRDLVERQDAGGMRCASLEARRGSGPSSGGEFIDAYLAEGDEIRRLQRRIGTGTAMVVRRVRPSNRGGARASVITNRALVDAICLQGKRFDDVLRAHGWAKSGKHVSCLRTALGACLESMAR